MVKVIMASVLSAWAVFSSGCASVDTGPPRDVAGTWSGQCNECPHTLLRLVLVQNGERLSGTLRGIGRSELGDPDVPLLGGKVTGPLVTFQVKIDDRERALIEANLRVSNDGRTMRGQMIHRSIFFVTFTRMGGKP